MNITALEEEDINSILQAHDPSILVDMVADRKQLPNTKNLPPIIKNEAPNSQPYKKN